jgi:hypothetical protein
MARDQVYNTIGAAQLTPISDNLDPLGGDEYEVPRGVIPVPLGYISQPSVNSHFTTSAGVTIANVRILIYIRRIVSFSDTLQATLTDGATTHTYSLSLALSTAANYTGWNWVTLPRTSGTGVIASGHTVTVLLQDTSVPLSDPDAYELAVGCYVSDDATYGSKAMMPYFQIMASATPFKWWANQLRKMEQLLSGTTYVNVAITGAKLFNTDATGTQYLATGSPEVPLSGAYFGSIVFNNKLYVSTVAANGTAAWTPAAAAANLGPTDALDAGPVMFSPQEWGGLIYFADINRTAIQTWNGLFPATVNTIVLGGKIGQPSSLINGLIIFQGSLYVFKPEGLFKVVSAISDISTNKVPDIIKVWGPPGGIALGATASGLSNTLASSISTTRTWWWNW